MPREGSCANYIKQVAGLIMQLKIDKACRLQLLCKVETAFRQLLLVTRNLEGSNNRVRFFEQAHHSLASLCIERRAIILPAVRHARLRNYIAIVDPIFYNVKAHPEWHLLNQCPEIGMLSSV